MNSINSILIGNYCTEKIIVKALLKYITGYSDSGLIINASYELSKRQLSEFDNLITQYNEGMPLAYLINYKEFYGRNFIVTSDTLIPRSETELLIDVTLGIINNNFNNKSNCRALDLGTGSGVIAITLKLEQPYIEVIAIDKYWHTLLVTKNNAKKLNADIHLIVSNWYAALNHHYKFDIIVSNPPYIAHDDEHLRNLIHEPQFALTDGFDGLTHIKAIINHAYHYLNNDGYLIIEHGYNQGLICRNLLLKFNLLHSNYQFIDINTINDYANLERILIAKFKIQ